MVAFGVEHDDCDDCEGDAEGEVDDVANGSRGAGPSRCDVSARAGTDAHSVEQEQAACAGEAVGGRSAAAGATGIALRAGLSECVEDGSGRARAVAGPSEDVIAGKAVGAGSDAGAGQAVGAGLADAADIEVVGRTAANAGVGAEDERRDAGGAVGGRGGAGEASEVAGRAVVGGEVLEGTGGAAGEAVRAAEEERAAA